LGSAGPAEFGSGARFFPQTSEDSELEIALLFPLCVASFAPFLFALSPRLYCEGVDEMGGEGAQKILMAGFVVKADLGGDGCALGT
jgi:hypothetical protein